MAATAPQILEGVFAVSKPPSQSSAQVLRDLQHTFASSQTFAPLLEDTRRKQAEQERHQPKRRKRGNDQVFKMGHGGTLDPLATGVLIVGIGRGTKHLQDFLGCTKTYDTVVLFGKSTDTYDTAGKIVGEAEYNHVTKELVESKLAQFRGTIRQVPPVYSALKINGMKAYEYARESKELPRELESREMQVDECTLLEWYDGGEHDFRWPAEEAPEDEKRAVSKLMGTDPPSVVSSNANATPPTEQAQSPQTEPQPTEAPVSQTPETEAAPTFATSPPAEPIPKSPRDQNTLSRARKASLHTHDHTELLSSTPAPSPAARIRLTVSSGFYVRSFAHDLGLACQSHGIMASLLRSRQAHFTTLDPESSLPPPPSSTTPTLNTSTSISSPSSNTSTQIPAITTSELAAGEEVWGPKLQAQLSKWMEENPSTNTAHVNGRDPGTRQKITEDREARPKQRFRGDWAADSKRDRIHQQGGKWKGKWNEGGNKGKMHERSGRRNQEGDFKRQRNSSSPE